jgi:glycolate oxidase
MLDPAVHAQLASVLPAEALLTSAEETRPYESDGLTMYREVPAAVAIPEDEAQLIAVLRRCHAAGVPVVARGAGTSLSGGALPDKRGVLVAMAKFRRIVSVDPVACTAVVQPGVRNLAISTAVAPLGLYYAPDPSSQIACTIGGNVAENAGGVHCLKYGLTVHNVRRVRAVLITGEVVEFGGDALDSAGYDLLALVHGSEVSSPSRPRSRSSSPPSRRRRRSRSPRLPTSERRGPRWPPSSAPESCPRGSK